MGEERAELFGFFGPPSRTGSRVRKVAGWLRRLKDRLAFSVLLSLAAHALLLGSVTIFRGADAAQGNGVSFSEFRRTLRDLETTFPDPEKLASLLAEVTEEDYFEAYKKDFLLDDRLTGSERASATKLFLSEALSRFKKRTGERSALDVPLSDLFGSPGAGPEVELEEGAWLFRMRDALLGTNRFFRLTRQKRAEIESLMTGVPEETSAMDHVWIQAGRNLDQVPRDYFYRDCPYDRMLAVGSRHFYIVRGFPEAGKTESDSGNLSAGRNRAERPSSVAREAVRPGFRVIYLPDFGQADNRTTPPVIRPRLNLTDDDVDRILDGLMTLPDEAQVEAFSRDYLQAFDPDDSGLARLTREFVYRNLGMVFMLADPLSSGFDFLEELHYDMFSMDELAAYGLRNSRTLTGTEILFCLAAAYEFESRAIVRLGEALENARFVLDGAAAPGVYNARAKAFVLREVYRESVSDLRRQGLASLDVVLGTYAEEQQKIYEFIAAGDPEARNRAFFALGSLHWAAGRRDKAIEKWRAIGLEYSTVTMDGIRAVLWVGERAADFESRIDRILQTQASADRSELLSRLKKFHKWSVRSEGLNSLRMPGWPARH